MATPFRPKFNKYYTGPWEFSPQDGVGLALTGKPTDVHAFIEALQMESCSPVATRRILDELEAGRTKYTTVRSYLQFDRIGDALAEVGVTMVIVPPAEPSDPRYDQAAFSLVQGKRLDVSEFSPEELRLIEQRQHHTQASLARIPHGFGAFV